MGGGGGTAEGVGGRGGVQQVGGGGAREGDGGGWVRTTEECRNARYEVLVVYPLCVPDSIFRWASYTARTCPVRTVLRAIGLTLDGCRTPYVPRSKPPRHGLPTRAPHTHTEEHSVPASRTERFTYLLHCAVQAISCRTLPYRIRAERNNYYRLERALSILAMHPGAKLADFEPKQGQGDPAQPLDYDFRCVLRYQ